MSRNKKIGSQIKQWLKEKNIKQREIAEYLEIKPPSLSQMLNGKIALPKDKLIKILNLVQPSKDQVQWVKALYFGEMAYLFDSPFGEDASPASVPLPHEVIPAQSLTEVPVISFAQAAGYEPALEPIDDYAKGCSDETAMFAHEMRPGYFALHVDGDSMSPDFPHGTIILVAGGEFPQRGDIVVAKLNEGQVVVKRYHRRNNVIYLESINPTGRSFEWHCKDDPGFIQWMYPVLEATIDLRKRRWEQTRCPDFNYTPIDQAQQYAVADGDKGYSAEQD